jgi:hypothetical protein
MATLADLLAYCARQARINACDYFEPGYAKPEEVVSWRADCRKRSDARNLCFRAFPGRLRTGSEQLVPGNYGPSGRLTIEPDGTADYTAGQYAPLEIYHALADYLVSTN